MQSGTVGAVVHQATGLTMLPLPWRKVSVNGEEHCILAGNIPIMLFQGQDGLPEFPTPEQRKGHIAYVEHAVNYYPKLQTLLEELYDMAGMPKAASAKIDAMLQQAYLTPERMPA